MHHAPMLPANMDHATRHMLCVLRIAMKPLSVARASIELEVLGAQMMEKAMAYAAKPVRQMHVSWQNSVAVSSGLLLCAADPANGRNAGPEGVTHPIRECHPAGGVRCCHHCDAVVGQGAGATTGRLAARRCAETAGTEPNVSATKRGKGEVNKIRYHRGQTLRARDAGAAGRTEISQPKGRPLGLFWLVTRWCLDSAIRDSRFAAATLATFVRLVRNLCLVISSRRMVTAARGPASIPLELFLIGYKRRLPTRSPRYTTRYGHSAPICAGCARHGTAVHAIA